MKLFEAIDAFGVIHVGEVGRDGELVIEMWRDGRRVRIHARVECVSQIGDGIVARVPEIDDRAIRRTAGEMIASACIWAGL